MSFAKFWGKSVSNRLIAIVLFLWIVFALLLIIHDLFISQSLFNPDDSTAKLVHYFGEIPGALFIIFALFVMNTQSKIKNKSHKKMLFVFEILLSGFLFTYILRLFFNFFGVGLEFKSLEGISFFLGLSLLSLFGFYIFKTKIKKFSEKNYLFAKVSIATFVISGLIIQALKLFWGRLRYEEVLSGVGEFTSWYLPQGLMAGYSFPSGHAFMAWALIPLFLFFPQKKKILKRIILALTILFSVFISYERVVIGAHYASDTLFSAGIVIMTFLFLYRKIIPEKKSFPTTKGKGKKKRK